MTIITPSQGRPGRKRSCLAAAPALLCRTNRVWGSSDQWSRIPPCRETWRVRRRGHTGYHLGKLLLERVMQHSASAVVLEVASKAQLRTTALYQRAALKKGNHEKAWADGQSSGICGDWESQHLQPCLPLTNTSTWSEPATCQEGEEGFWKAPARSHSAAQSNMEFCILKSWKSPNLERSLTLFPFTKPSVKTWFTCKIQTFQSGFSCNYQWNPRAVLPVTTIMLFNRERPPYDIISEVKHVKH